MKRIIAILCLVGVLFSCGTQKRRAAKKAKKEKVVVVPNTTEEEGQTKEEPIKEVTVTTTSETYTNPTESYIAIFSDIAQSEMKNYGIPASITLAQGILESGSGKGRLSLEANNHFGIKCHSNWTGGKIYHDDDKDQECFRKYKNAKYSFRDHSLFLKDRKRYSKLFTLKKDDYKGWAKGLKAAGYATDRKYPAKLIALIERYQLYRFDYEVLGKQINRNDKHTVIKGDTLYALSKTYNISVDTLKTLNGLDSNTLYEGQILFVKPLPKE